MSSKKAAKTWATADKIIDFCTSDWIWNQFYQGLRFRQILADYSRETGWHSLFTGYEAEETFIILVEVRGVMVAGIETIE